MQLDNSPSGSQVKYVQVGEESAGQRLDNFLFRLLKGVPKSLVYRIIRQGEVRINKKRAKPTSRLALEDSVRIPPVRTRDQRPVTVTVGLSKHLKSKILFEDKYFLVLNKPSGMAVHGGSGLQLGLIEAMRLVRDDLHYLELAHRLDRETSGCLVFAKKRSALRALHALFTERQIQKTYWTLLCGAWIGKNEITVNQSLEKNTLQSGERMVRVCSDGKPSQTKFTLIKNYATSCWVEAKPETGRTHQIRVHAADIGHPIIGDGKYGGDKAMMPIGGREPKLCLHARAIQFNLFDNCYKFEAPCEDYFIKTQLCLEQCETS